MSDTSVVSNLAIIGRLHLVRSQFQIVWIPEAVRAELNKIPNMEARALIADALQDGWLQWRAVGNPLLAAALSNDLDSG